MPETENPNRAAEPRKDSIRPRSQIDAHIGKRLQALRRERDVTRKTLGERLGISSVQVLKYELGLARLGPARLFAIADIFGMPITAFFEGLI